MTWIIVLLIIIFASAIGGFVYTQQKKSKGKTEKQQETPVVDPTEQREDAIVSLQTQAALLGVTRQTNINALIDKCVEVHESLSSVNPQERSQLHSVPGDFSRLIEIHLPELLVKFGQISESATDEDIQKFNGLLEQLQGELNTILKNIADRNYVAFASKHGFMEIRYSDKF